MAGACKVAIVAALEGEVSPLVKQWRRDEAERDGRHFRFFANESTVVVCGGIGSKAARRAAEAVIAIYRPQLLLSVGFAGGLDGEIKVGQVLWPQTVIDANDGSRVEVTSGKGSLVSFSAVADSGQKAKLGAAYGAQAVDMEAAAVARVAQIHGIGFAAAKAVSDEMGFAMPDMERFVTPDGRFRSSAFAWFALMRPWLWPRLMRLSRNSAKAAQALCSEIDNYLRNGVPVGERQVAAKDLN